MGAANIRPLVVEIFSELVNSATEHGMSEADAHAHVRFMPHRRGKAFDAVIADPGPGIRATLSRNPELPETESGRDAIGLAVQELVSGTGAPTRGIGLWMTVNEMKKAGPKLRIRAPQHVGRQRTRTQGNQPPAGTVVPITIPA